MNEFNKSNVIQRCLYSYRQRQHYHSGQNVVVRVAFTVVKMFWFFVVVVFVFQEAVGWRSLTHSILINLFFEPGFKKNFSYLPCYVLFLSKSVQWPSGRFFHEGGLEMIFFFFSSSAFAHTMKAGRGIYNCGHVSFTTARSRRQAKELIQDTQEDKARK